MSTLNQFTGGAIKSIQRGSVSTSSGSDFTKDVTITTVSDLNKTLVELIGVRIYGTSNASTFNDMMLTVVDASTLRASRQNVTYTATAYYQVTEFY